MARVRPRQCEVTLAGVAVRVIPDASYAGPRLAEVL